VSASESASAVKRVSLDQVSFPRLLFALLRQRFTGVVRLQQSGPAPGARTVWFRGGMPVFTDWYSQADVLGEVLMQRGLIDAGAFNQALATMAKQGGLLGQLLLAQGALDFSQLSDGLRMQCTRKLLHVFALRQGELEVEVTEHGLGNGDELSNQVNALGLIRLGVGKHYDEARIRAEMGEAFDGPIAATQALGKYKDRFGYRPADAHMLAALGQGGTIAEMAVPGVNRERLAQTAYVLWACQMLLVGEAGAKLAAEHRAKRDAGASTTAGRRAPPPPPPQGATAAPKAAPNPPPPRSKPQTSSPAAPPDPASSAPSAAASNAGAAGETQAKPAKKPGRKKAASKAPPPPDPKDGEFGERLHEFEKRIADGAHAFALFGLDLEVGRKEVRKVWAELSKEFHPDSLESRGLSHLHERVEDVFAAISEANGTLQNKDSRENLKSAIEMGGTGQAGEDATTLVRNALEGEMIAREADKLLRANNFTRALEQYEKSLALSANDPEVIASASWCRYQIGQRTKDAGKRELEVLTKITAETPMCARAHYYEGLVRNNLGDLVGARDAFKKALEVDARMVEAERQLRAMRIKLKQSKDAKETEKKSAFGSLKGLFGKK